MTTTYIYATDYRLENLSEDEFEKLVNMLCERVLGIGTVSFSKGKDGGRDGRFEGKANDYPSSSEPWVGKFIIQAKHTDNYQASCSDKPFHGNESSIINGEIKKIKTLKDNGEIHNYLLFTNRKETANREDAIKHIRVNTGLDNVDIIGKETIHRWLSQYDDIVKLFKLGKYALPLILTEFEIKSVIIAFGQQINPLKNISTVTEDDIIKGIPKIEKNKLNILSQEYYDNQIRRKSQQYFEDIDRFLLDFNNQDFAKMYHDFAYELSNKIAVKRSTFDKFEEIFDYLYNHIFEENRIELGKDKRLIWIFLHHLYFNCHIGRVV